MEVNESVRIEREKIIKARQEDIRRRKAERERKEREERIRIKREKEEKEREEKIRIEKEKERKERKERIKREREEKERNKMKGFFKRFAELWKEESLGDKIAITLGIILFIVGPFMMISKIASYFDSFEQFMDAIVGIFVFFAILIALNFDKFVVYLKIIGIVVGLIIVSLFVGYMESLPNYTKPHRYIVQDNDDDL